MLLIRLFSKTNQRFIFAFNVFYRLMLGLFLILLLQSCQTAPLEIKSHLSEVDFAPYKAVKVETLNKAEHPTIMKISSAIEQILQGKGYELSEEPDLVVVYQAESISGSRFELETIPAKGRVYQRPKLEAVIQAHLLVNAYDPKLDRVVWKASTTREITHLPKKALDEKHIKKRMEELLASFPQR